MTKRMLIDATQPEETRVAVVENERLDSYDFDSALRKQIKGNIFLAKVTRVEPSLQACFVEYGGNRQGFLAFTEIHTDYYKIPQEDREALAAEEAASWANDDEEEDDAILDVPTSDDEIRGPDEIYDKPPADMQLVNEDAQTSKTSKKTSSAVAEDKNGDEGEDLPKAPNLVDVPRDNTVESIGGEEDDSEQEEVKNTRQRRMGQLRRRYKIQEVIRRRNIMLVQATKEERGSKGAAMTTYISLPGRYCVLMPNSPRGGGVSRKITDPNARRKMKDLLSELDVPNGMSVILRTAGMTRTRLEIKKDLEYLLRLWDEIRRETMRSEAPALVYEEADIFKRVIRDLYSGETQEVIVSGEEGFRKVKQFMRQMVPAHAKKVYYYRDPLIPLFQRYGVEAQIADIFNPRVELRSGGYIIINPTEALVSIDVNSGRATRERHIDDTALKTNMEAAEEIARQLRLRDLGGLVVIDFIDMESGRHNAKVERKLREAMSEDRARIEIGRISGFGLLELSRQRLHPSLTETHFEPCAHCGATGITRTTESASVVVMRAIEAEAVRGRSISITASIPQQVAIYLLNHKREDIIRIEEHFGCRVSLRADENLAPNEINMHLEKGTPQPKKKIDLLPVPILEGSDDDYLVQDEEDDGEPLIANALAVEGEITEGRPNTRRRRTGNRTRPQRGRNRRSDEDNENGETSRVDIAITEGAPQPDDSGLAEQTGATESADESAPRSRSRRGERGRNPYRRRRNDSDRNGDDRNSAKPDQAAEPAEKRAEKPAEPAPKPVAASAIKTEPKPAKKEEKTVANSNDTSKADTAKAPQKKVWWQSLIE